MKTRFLPMLALAGLIGVTACTADEREAEVVEEPTIEAPATAPVTAEPLDEPANRPFDPALDVNNNGILDPDEGLGDADNDGILDRDEEYVPPTQTP